MPRQEIERTTETKTTDTHRVTTRRITITGSAYDVAKKVEEYRRTGKL